MITKSRHTTKEVFDVMVANGLSATSFHGDFIKFKTLTLMNFRKHGVTCVSCRIEGSIFLKQKHNDDIRRWHLNLYAKESNGNLILMTRDHIIPISRGGKDILSNLQTMCQDCNGIKSNRLPSEITKPIIPRQDKWISWDTFRRRIKFFYYTILEDDPRWPTYGRKINDKKRESIRAFWIE